ncbi:MAG: transcriptional regulator [Siphonobacter aquaeclarae]|nr:transcriptional regulator [Siphonobacter aquaeclarae]
MTYDEGKEALVQAWGTLGSKWGISRTMSQIHILLLTSPEPLTTEDVMEQLQISRGNANMNLRDLIGWGIIRKVLRAGERKEYFEAERDVWKVAMQVARERKRRELEPLLAVLDQVSTVEGEGPEVARMTEAVRDLKKFANNADRLLDTMIKAEENWFWGNFLKVLR